VHRISLSLAVSRDLARLLHDTMLEWTTTGDPRRLEIEAVVSQPETVAA
jgi:hypothetical protein